MPHLLLTVGGYSFAVWNEGIMNKPVILHFVNDEQFTAASWSLTQPNTIFFSTDRGNIQIWDVTKRRSEPFQVQNIAGKSINGICPFEPKTGGDRHYLSVSDDTGVLRLMQLPKHLWTVSEQAVSICTSTRKGCWTFCIFSWGTRKLSSTRKSPRKRRRKGSNTTGKSSTRRKP